MPKPAAQRCLEGGWCNMGRVGSTKRKGVWYITWRCDKCQREEVVTQ